MCGEISISPKQFFFGFLDKGTVTSREVTVTKEGANDLEILRIEKNSIMIVTEVDVLEQGKKYQVKATCTAKEKGVCKDIIKILTNNVKQPILEVPLYAIVR